MLFNVYILLPTWFIAYPFVGAVVSPKAADDISHDVGVWEDGVAGDGGL